MENFKELLLLNTIANNDNPNGFTYGDLTEIDPHIPHTRIYRAIKKMHEMGYLNMKEEDVEIPGRPKHFYFLNEFGKQRHAVLKQTILSMFETVQEHLEQYLDEVDLHQEDFSRFRPINKILSCNESVDQKREKLEEMEEFHQEMLKKITEAKEKLQKDT